MTKTTLFLFLVFSFLSPTRAQDLILAKDIVVPRGQDYVDLPVVSVDGPKIRTGIGYGIYFESWISKKYVCRIHLKTPVKELRKGTVLVLDGRHEVERAPHGIWAHKFFVEEPEEVDYICCGVYADHYRSLLGEKARLVGRTFPELLDPSAAGSP